MIHRIDSRVWLIARTEMAEFFESARGLHLIPLTLVCLIPSVWPEIPSPFVLVVPLILVGLEPQFNNILFRTSNELVAVTLLPIEWGTMILGKNLATIGLTVVVCLVVSIPFVYFAPRGITLKEYGEGMLLLGTLIFPLLHTGNAQSIRSPRRECGWQPQDFFSALEMLVFVVVFSLPYLVFRLALDSALLCGLYALAAATVWYFHAVPTAGRDAQSRSVHLCETA